MPKRTGDVERSEQAILDELDALRVEILDAEATVTNLYDRRAVVLVEARTRQTPIVQARLAKAAGVTEAAIIRVLRLRGIGPRDGRTDT